ncbi:MAG: hypothetical protein LBF25_01785, partial [Puniceicoccales bacterium]|nr:hypothetical protein [Puniceicoccales bacterium]
MGKIWKKLCALTGLFALLMLSPRSLLAAPGNSAPTGIKIGTPRDNETPTLKTNSAGNLGNASFASAAAEIRAANESSGHSNGKRNIVLANEITGKAESIPFVGSTAGESQSVALTVSSVTEECAKNVIPIILSADNNFAPPMYITMFSILKNSNKDTYYHFHLLVPSNFEQRYKDEITKLGEKYDCKITFIDMGAAFTNMFPTGWPPSASYRLIAADLLPNYGKCLYIDVDVLVRYDLGELY